MVGVPSAPDCADIIAYLALANANDTAVMVHTFYNGPACSRPCMRVPLSADPGVLVEWRYFRDFEAQLYGDDIIPKNGAIAVPQRGGLGLEPRRRLPRLPLGLSRRGRRGTCDSHPEET